MNNEEFNSLYLVLLDRLNREGSHGGTLIMHKEDKRYRMLTSKLKH
jgi:hypothetical protein